MPSKIKRKKEFLIMQRYASSYWILFHLPSLLRCSYFLLSLAQGHSVWLIGLSTIISCKTFFKNECDTKNILSRVKLVWIRSFPPPRLLHQARPKTLVWPYIYAWLRGEIDRFIPFPGALPWRELQTVLPRIWNLSHRLHFLRLLPFTLNTLP